MENYSFKSFLNTFEEEVLTITEKSTLLIDVKSFCYVFHLDYEKVINHMKREKSYSTHLSDRRTVNSDGEVFNNIYINEVALVLWGLRYRRVKNRFHFRFMKECTKAINGYTSQGKHLILFDND